MDDGAGTRIRFILMLELDNSVNSSVMLCSWRRGFLIRCRIEMELPGTFATRCIAVERGFTSGI